MNDDGNDIENFSSSFFLLLLDLTCDNFELVEIYVPHHETNITVNSVLNCIPFHSTSSLGKARYRGLVDLKRVKIKTNFQENLKLKVRDIYVPIPLGHDIDECIHASNLIMNCPETILKLGVFTPSNSASYPLREVLNVGKIDWNNLSSLTEDETCASSCDESSRGK